MDNRITYLYNRYLSKSLSQEELQEFKEILADPDQQLKLNDLIDNDWDQLKEETLMNIPEHTQERVFKSIISPQSIERPQRSLWPRIAVAASVIIALSFGGYFLTHKKQVQPNNAIAKNDIAPGGNKAILTLANGKQIILTGAHNGKLAVQGNTAVNKTADGLLVYEAPKAIETANQTVSYNTIKTPKTGKFDVVLPDGTKVSLDALSSIRFPTAFTGNERKIEITGQAYFEVAHDKTKPFRVSSKGQTVEVLGTHFNINAYDDEPSMKTTLLEGSVKILSNGEMAILKPGQQALVAFNSNKGISIIDQVDLEEILAWKNGDFDFNGEDLRAIMRKVSRWYDVEVIYQSVPNNLVIEGQVSRSKNMSAVLAAMEATGKVHFKIEGRRITVMQ